MLGEKSESNASLRLLLDQAAKYLEKPAGHHDHDHRQHRRHDHKLTYLALITLRGSPKMAQAGRGSSKHGCNDKDRFDRKYDPRAWP